MENISETTISTSKFDSNFEPATHEEDCSIFQAIAQNNIEGINSYFLLNPKTVKTITQNNLNSKKLLNNNSTPNCLLQEKTVFTINRS